MEDDTGASPQVPNTSHAVLSSSIHPAAILMEAHWSDVLTDTIIVYDRVGIVWVQVIHANVLIACNINNIASFFSRWLASLKEIDEVRARRIFVQLSSLLPAAAIMLLSGVTSREFTCWGNWLRKIVYHLSIQRSARPLLTSHLYVATSKKTHSAEKAVIVSFSAWCHLHDLSAWNLCSKRILNLDAVPSLYRYHCELAKTERCDHNQQWLKSPGHSRLYLG